MAFCQQGFQFFPDTLAAMREIHRVLRPKGHLAITVWAGPSGFFQLLLMHFAITSEKRLHSSHSRHLRLVTSTNLLR
jgi:ubiquinone/menaquinone biosynthesis C-methylase UbiE